MKHGFLLLAGGLAVVLTTGCSSNDEYVAKLRAAMEQSQVTLAETVTVAEADTQPGAALRAALLVDGDPVFSVRAFASADALRRYHIDLAGQIITEDPVAAGGGLCPGAISLLQAITVAETEAGGVGVAIVPDDDVACAFEVQVLTPDTLWEVKVGSGGEVLESEESDEDGTEDDD